MPGIDQTDAAILEITHVARGQRGTVRPRNARDHRLGLVDRAPLGTPRGSDGGVRIGGSRCGSRGGSSSSIPLKGSTWARMAAYSEAPESPSTRWAKAARRMLHAASSIDRPCCAARIRRHAFRSSSRFRMVMVAVDRTPEMLATNELLGTGDAMLNNRRKH